MSDTSNGLASTGTSARRKSSVLRNSCDTCAASKIRCTKEKPECSKCLSRGLACNYSVPRRPGRPAQNKQHSRSESGAGSPSTGRSNSGHSRSHSQVLDNGTEWNFDTSKSVQHTESILASSRASPSLLSDHSNTLGLPVSEPWHTVPALSSAEMEELFNLDCFNQDFTTLDVSEGLFDDIKIDRTQPSSSDCIAATAGIEQVARASFSPFRFDSPPHAVSGFPTGQNHGNPLSTTSSESSSRTQSSEDGLNNLYRSATNDDLTNMRSLGQQMGSCSCQARALDLMILPTPFQTSQGRSSATEIPSFESVLDLNATVTEAMWQILQCPCIKDAYQLVVLALSTCKTLEWFDAAASTLLVAPPMASIGGIASSEQDASRMAAQIVLSRLPSVQRVVDNLSGQLHFLFQDQELGLGSIASAEGADLDASESTNHQFLSAHLARSLEVKLRKRTREMARRVIAQLR